VSEPRPIGVDVFDPIDPLSPVARYRQISDRLASMITDADPGTRVPSEPEIVARLGVSRATATQALRDLEQRGLVVRRQGKGTFVAESERAIRTNRTGTLPSFSEDLRKAGRSTRERVIALDVVGAPEDVATALAIPAGHDVWRVERVIVGDDEPVVHLISWLPCAVFGTLTRTGIEQTSLYEQLRTTDGSPLRPCAADESWSAETAPAATATLFELPKNRPVMRVVRTAFLHDGTAAEHSIAYVRGETFAVSMRIDAHNHAGRSLGQLSPLLR